MRRVATLRGDGCVVAVGVDHTEATNMSSTLDSVVDGNLLFAFRRHEIRTGLSPYPARTATSSPRYEMRNTMVVPIAETDLAREACAPRLSAAFHARIATT